MKKESGQFLKQIFFIIISFCFLFSVSQTVLADTNSAKEPDCVPPKCLNCSTKDEALCHQYNFFGQSGYKIIPGAGEQNTATIAGRVGVLVDTAMSLTGIIFLAIAVFSGIQWMMAGGNEETVKKARTRITNATIGLVIVVGSWAIVNFVLTSLIFPGQAVSSWGPFSWKSY